MTLMTVLSGYSPNLLHWPWCTQETVDRNVSQSYYDDDDNEHFWKPDDDDDDDKIESWGYHKFISLRKLYPGGYSKRIDYQ